MIFEPRSYLSVDEDFLYLELVIIQIILLLQKNLDFRFQRLWGFSRAKTLN